MKVTINVKNKRIRELIESAGSRYWAKDLKLGRGLAFSIVEYEDGPEKTHRVTTAKVKKGLTKLANAERNEGGHHFADVLDEMSSDMYTGDAVIQFAVFGELKYG